MRFYLFVAYTLRHPWDSSRFFIWEGTHCSQGPRRDAAAFHRCRFQTPILWLLLDGIRLRVKTPTGVQQRLVICAYGLTPAGPRRLLSFRQAKAESAAAWGSGGTAHLRGLLLGDHPAAAGDCAELVRGPRRATCGLTPDVIYKVLPVIHGK